MYNMLYFGIITSNFVRNLKSLVIIPIIYHVTHVVYLKSLVKPSKSRCYTLVYNHPGPDWLIYYWGPLYDPSDLEISEIGPHFGV